MLRRVPRRIVVVEVRHAETCLRYTWERCKFAVPQFSLGESPVFGLERQGLTRDSPPELTLIECNYAFYLANGSVVLLKSFFHKTL